VRDLLTLPFRSKFAVAAALAIPAGLAATAFAAAPTPSGAVSITALGTYDGGGLARAEIVAFNAASDRMLISNDDQVQVDIVSITDPANPFLVTSFDLSQYGDGVNGVSSYGNLVAAAVERNPIFNAETGVPTPQAGSIVFFDTDGNFVREVVVGVLPDAVTFTPDGSKLVVSGEAEPVCAQDVTDALESEDPTLAVDPDGTIGVIDITAGNPEATATLLDFSGFDTATLQAAGVRIFFPGSTAQQDLEPEYAAISDDSSTAWVSLQEANALAVVDLTVPEIVAVVPLGTKAFAPVLMDPSDKDSGIELANWDVQGMYMPDAIDAFSAGGSTYLATANEGDSRDYSCFSEEVRMKDLDLTGSPLEAGLIAAAGDDAQLGRLKTTTATPTATPVDTLYAYGARSFTIWNSAGQVVWDSGSQFEEFVAANYPDYFNTHADDGAAAGADMVASMADPDARSDDKGIEPESVIVGSIGARLYAFVGLERQGGIMVYDVTDPTAPVFEDYVNVALDELAAAGTFTDPGTTDVSPEGIAFVAAADSPNGKPLLLVANELSGTTTVYQVTGSEIDAQLAPTPTTTSPAATTTVAPTTLPSTGADVTLLLGLAAAAGTLVLSGAALRGARRR
jgi:2',3'-cyclic-nucleotide 2'-phosphodiesterase/3'-nucleotidase/5'-nucleotidase